MHGALPERQVMRRRVNDVEMAEVVPGCSTQSNARDSSTSTAISWPRDSMFASA